MSVRRIPVLMTLFFISASVVAHSATGHAASPAAAGAEAQAVPAAKPTQAKPPQSKPSAATADPTPASGARIAAEFKGSAVNLERVAGETITIDIRHWSSDEDKAKLFAAYSEGAQKAAESIQKAESVGYIWRSGSGIGQSLRYAFESKLPDGRQRIILVTPDNLTEWGRKPGVASSDPAPPLTIVELRLPASGTGPGEGKLSAKIAADSASHLLTIDGYDSTPAAFKPIARATPQ